MWTYTGHRGPNVTILLESYATRGRDVCCIEFDDFKKKNLSLVSPSDLWNYNTK